MNELIIIQEFLPKEITKEQIEEEFVNILSNGVEPIKKNMGLFIKEIKNKYPMADGKLVSGIVASKLN